MKHISTLTDSSLRFIAADCFAAIQANPDNQKVPQYFAERQACFKELERRERVRRDRETLRLPLDRLQFPLSIRRRLRTVSDYERTRLFSSRFSLGWHKVHGNN